MRTRNLTRNTIVCFIDPVCGISNVLKNFITCYSVNKNTKITCNPNTILGNYDTILDSKHIADGSEKNVQKVIGGWRLLVLKQEEKDQINIPDDFRAGDPLFPNPKT